MWLVIYLTSRYSEPQRLVGKIDGIIKVMKKSSLHKGASSILVHAVRSSERELENYGNRGKNQDFLSWSSEDMFETAWSEQGECRNSAGLKLEQEEFTATERGKQKMQQAFPSGEARRAEGGRMWLESTLRGGAEGSGGAGGALGGGYPRGVALHGLLLGEPLDEGGQVAHTGAGLRDLPEHPTGRGVAELRELVARPRVGGLTDARLEARELRGHRRRRRQRERERRAPRRGVHFSRGLRV